MLEKAGLRDAVQIHKLINVGTSGGFLLPRPLAELYESIRDFFVVRDEGKVVAAAALKIIWEDLAEIRSLVVMDGYRGKGLGRALVNACFDEARTLGVKRVFVLSDSPSYFINMGFSAVDKKVLPQKVWFDCVKCPKFPDCDEVALIKEV